MISTELADVGEKLSALWPDLTPDELSLLTRKVRSLEYHRTIQAIEEFRLGDDGDKRRPRLGSLARACFAANVQVQQHKHHDLKTVVAQNHVKARPHLRGAPEAAVILDYHRWQFFTKRRSVIDHAKLPESSPEVRALIDHALAIYVRQCEHDLFNAGLSPDMALSLAGWIDCPQEQWADFVRDQVPMAVTGDAMGDEEIADAVLALPEPETQEVA